MPQIFTDVRSRDVGSISGGGGGGDSDGLVIPEFGVTPLEDSGTDLEDELPTPDGLPSTDASKLVLGPTSPGGDLELARALLEGSYRRW